MSKSKKNTIDPEKIIGDYLEFKNVELIRPPRANFVDKNDSNLLESQNGLWGHLRPVFTDVGGMLDIASIIYFIWSLFYYDYQYPSATYSLSFVFWYITCLHTVQLLHLTPNSNYVL